MSDWACVSGGLGAQAVCALWVNSVPAAEVLYEKEQSGGSCPSAEQLLFFWRAPFMDHRPGVGRWICRPSSSSACLPPPQNLPPPQRLPTLTPKIVPHPPWKPFSTMPDEEWHRGTWGEQEGVFVFCVRPPWSCPSAWTAHSWGMWRSISQDKHKRLNSVLKHKQWNTAQTLLALATTSLQSKVCEWTSDLLFFCLFFSKSQLNHKADSA